MMGFAPPLDGNPCLTLFKVQACSGTAICGRSCVPKTFSFYGLRHVIKTSPSRSSGTRTLMYAASNSYNKGFASSSLRHPPLGEPSNVDAGIGRMFRSMEGFQQFAINSISPGRGFEETGVPKYEEEKVGVLLLNLGGPETLDDVQPFLYNLFADPDIIRLPRLLRFFQRPLAQIISVIRAPKSIQGYAAIGGGSPLRKITEEQASALQEALEGKGISAKVYIGMRYWHPYIEEAIKMIKQDGITRLVVLPLYPQFSISTSGSSLRILEEIFWEDEYLVNMQHTVIPSWCQREGYVKVMSNLIDKQLKNFTEPNEVIIFFSAHGVPRTYVEKEGDPYKQEMECCVKLIMTELRLRGLPNKHILAYQSRVGPTEWLKPYTDDTIKELGLNGVKSLLAVPISFVSEHIETLEEIDVEYQGLAVESGITNWGRVPALGCEQAFISDLADAVTEALPHVGAMAVSGPEAHPVWTISRTLENYFQPYGGRAWMEWLSGC